MVAKVATLTTFILYKTFGKLESLFKRLAEFSDHAEYKCHEWNWHSKMPSNVSVNAEGWASYSCPFCDTDLDYRFNFDGVLCGVCWPCKKAWYDKWDNSDCPDFDNCNWPTKENALREPPSAFWEDSLYHWVKTNEDGLKYDGGKAEGYRPQI